MYVCVCNDKANVAKYYHLVKLQEKYTGIVELFVLFLNLFFKSKIIWKWKRKKKDYHQQTGGHELLT